MGFVLIDNVYGVYKAIRFMLNNMLQRIKAALARRAEIAYCWICHLLPIQKNVIIFESEGDYCDNAWALYDYLRRTRIGKYKYVWVVANPARFKSTNDTMFLTRFGSQCHWLLHYYYATARINFYTHWTLRPYLARRGQDVVNLWHGMPLKGAIGENRDYFDWCIVVGEYARMLQCRFMGREKDFSRMLPLGYPRNDLLLQNIGNGKDNPLCVNKTFNKLVIWMPTFRVSINSGLTEKECDTETGLPLLRDGVAVEQFNTFLKRINVLIALKIHHLQAKKPIFSKEYSNITFWTDNMLADKGYQLYQLVGKSDALLTDYSSITVDYLLTGKPQGFILEDISNYLKGRGFVVDSIEELKSYLPGEYIYSLDDLERFICNVANGNDNFNIERNILLNKIHVAAEGDACKRICERFGI